MGEEEEAKNVVGVASGADGGFNPKRKASDIVEDGDGKRPEGGG